MEPLRGQVTGHGGPTRYELQDYTTFDRGPDFASTNPSSFADDDHGFDVNTHNSHSRHASQQKLPLVGATSTDSLCKAGLEPATHVLWNGLPHFLLSWDLIGVVVSICFLALGICAVALSGKEESRQSLRITRAMEIAPSIWPIVFSGVLGNALRSYADWKVERGVHLMALEQLMGSLTMAGSLITIFRWSLFRLASVGLIILWAFNPLGSQASFRGISLQKQIQTDEGIVTYVDPDVRLLPKSIMFDTTLGTNRRQPTVQSIYAASIYDVISRTQNVDERNPQYLDLIQTLGGRRATINQAATDLWGNVRIPHLEYLAGYDSRTPYDKVDVSSSDSIGPYVSLIGDIINGVGRILNGTTSFGIQSSYQKFNCSSWSILESDGMEAWYKATLNTTRVANATFSGTVNEWIFLASPSVNQACNTPDYHTPLYFGSRVEVSNASSSAPWAITQCNLNTTYVDADVECTTPDMGRVSCRVRKIGKTLTPPTPPDSSLIDGCIYLPNGTRIENGYGHQGGLNRAFTNLLNMAQTGSGAAGIVERYLHNPLTAFDESRSSIASGMGTMHETDIKIIERRISLLYNTLWKASWMYPAVVSGNLSAFENSLKTVRNPYLTSPSSEVYLLPPVYIVNIPWMVLYFVSVAVMSCAAVFTLVMRSQCRAPTILGFVSSLARDSLYFNDPMSKLNSTTDGMDMSKRLASVKIMVGDVKADGDHGKIALAPDGLVQRVTVKRWYE